MEEPRTDLGDNVGPMPAEAPPTEKAPTEKLPELATLGRRGGPASPTLGDRLAATMAQGGGRLWIILLAVLGVALILAALFLPPFSLLERMGVLGYTPLNAGDSSVVHPDGITLSVDPASFKGKLKVRLESVPRLELLEGSAGAALRKAVEPAALPAHLAIKSPYYRIQARGKASQPVTIDVAVPNDAEPWQLLDLYTWDGKAWQWLGGELHTEEAGHEFIRAVVNELPVSVVVMQAGPVQPRVSTYLEPGDSPVSTGSGAVDEVSPTGLYLGTLGGFAGDSQNLPQSDVSGIAVVPALRNWAPGATVNRGLLYDLLTIPEAQDEHIAKITQLCAERGFGGIEIDYRGVLPEERVAFTAFISALADALHAQGLRLAVVPELTQSASGYWDEGGYDWAALGAAADVVKVRFPADPAAYVSGGEAERLLDWAKARVSRYKLHMLVSSLSAEQSGMEANPVGLEQALAPFGQVVALQDTTAVQPGSQLEFGLSGSLLSITPIEASTTYRLEYKADDGQTRTIWLGTAADLAAKLQWAQNYHLGGVTVADLLDPGNAQGIAVVLAGYRSGAMAPVDQKMEVLWAVTDGGTMVDQQSTPLTEPTYRWMVLAAEGTYKVSASIAGFDHGAVEVTIAAPAPVVTTTAAVTSTAGLTKTVDTATVVTTTASACLNASYVADVSIPDNTQLDNAKEFEKTWRVRNSGTCPWPADTVLTFVSGTQMEAPASVEVGVLDAGAQKDITVKMKSPAEAGQFTGVWRMKSAQELFGGSLTVVIRAGNAPVAIAPVSGGSFELGGHVRDVGLPYASRMHYAGMTWTKVQVHFGEDASGIIGVAHANGFKIQLSALGSPGMVTQAGFESSFASWVAGLAAAGADAIEVWNEPNIDREWQIGSISPQAYTRLLCAAYSAIKGANSSTAVISAAPAPTGYFGGCSANGCDDAPWMAGLRDSGAANCMDYIGAHHNSGATSPSARSGHPAGGTHHSWYFLPQTEMYYSTFGGARKLFYTEMGYASQEGVPTFSDQFGWARGTDTAEQAAWLAEAVSLSVNTGMVRCIVVWNIDFVRYGYDPQDGYAIIRPDGSCPACESLHAVLGTR